MLFHCNFFAFCEDFQSSPDAAGGRDGKKLVQFGAGNIGRSFIGQLFARGGYEVVFIDINPLIVDSLNRQRKYRIIIKRNDLPDEEIVVENVRAVDGKDADRAAAEIANTSILATSVGKSALPHILPVIAKGLVERQKNSPGLSLDIIIAENVRNAADFFKQELANNLPRGYPFEKLIGLVETSIGKMVPIMKEEDIQKDPLWIFAEEYNSLILDKKSFKNPIPKINGIQPVENIAAYVDRKLFIHNLGHAASAYFGFQHNPGFIFVWEALKTLKIFSRVKNCMHQAAAALNREYPADLSMTALNAHIDDLLARFQNKALGDTIFRVGRDLYRKLGKDDRLVGAMLLAKKHDLECGTMAEAVLAACGFRACDEHGGLYPDDQKFADKDFPLGINHILTTVCKLSAENPLESAVMEEILTRAKRG
ncbi:MAG: mannitol-1-phosphate 5-dehydrogenase [Spirochaetota bacterium]